jgi:hypothetical protein
MSSKATAKKLSSNPNPNLNFDPNTNLGPKPNPNPNPNANPIPKVSNRATYVYQSYSEKTFLFADYEKPTYTWCNK